VHIEPVVFFLLIPRCGLQVRLHVHIYARTSYRIELASRSSRQLLLYVHVLDLYVRLGARSREIRANVDFV
jgi:hypothetical protein